MNNNHQTRPHPIYYAAELRRAVLSAADASPVPDLFFAVANGALIDREHTNTVRGRR